MERQRDGIDNPRGGQRPSNGASTDDGGVAVIRIKAGAGTQNLTVEANG